jgi:hypothetical protein
MYNPGLLFIAFIALGLPGIIFLVRGLKTLITKKRILLGYTVPLQRWAKPLFAKGNEAVGWAKIDIGCGLFFIIAFLLVLISQFV